MDVNYAFQGINFAWHDEKASANFGKHGVLFESACEAFFDPFFIVEDAGVVEGEPREAVIGLTKNWQLLFVVYVMLGEVARLISARAATSGERKRYENQ